MLAVPGVRRDIAKGEIQEDGRGKFKGKGRGGNGRRLKIDEGPNRFAPGLSWEGGRVWFLRECGSVNK